MRTLLLPLLFLLFIVVSCTKDDIHQDKNLQDGSWVWVRSVPLTAPGATANATYPLPGFEYLLTFKANNIFIYTRNGHVIESGAYLVKSNGHEWTLKKANDEATLSIEISQDSLRLVSSMPGAGYSIFGRQR
jgi:hypothetical protein